MLAQMIHEFIRTSPAVSELRQDVSVLKQDVSILKQDVIILKQDVSILKQDVSILKQDVSILKQDMRVVKEEQHRQGLILEDMQGTMGRILEVLAPVIKKGELVDSHVEVLVKHREDLAVTRAVLRDHVTNKAIHRSERETEDYQD